MRRDHLSGPDGRVVAAAGGRLPRRRAHCCHGRRGGLGEKERLQAHGRGWAEQLGTVARTVQLHTHTVLTHTLSSCTFEKRNDATLSHSTHTPSLWLSTPPTRHLFGPAADLARLSH